MTEAGKRAAHGHTASITSSVAVFDTLCRQIGAIQVDDIEELIDMLVALRFASPLPQGTGIAVVGTGGGPSVLAGDEMERAGLQLPRLSPEVQGELRQFLPLAGSIFSNPVDAANLLYPEAISATMRTVGRVPDVHMLIYHLGFHPTSRWGNGRIFSLDLLQPVVSALVEARQAIGKPVLLALRHPPDLCGMNDFLIAQEALVGAGFPVFYSLSQAARAMARVVAWDRS
jgi:acyl-CoA synthetase (NDP forming)